MGALSATQLSLLISLVSNGAGWLAQEIAIARREGTISDEDFERLLKEAESSDQRVKDKYKQIQGRLNTSDGGE